MSRWQQLDRSAPCFAPHHHHVGDDHQYRSNRDCDEPADPIDSGAAVATEQNVDVPADEDTTDATQDGEPDRDVVPSARSNKLAEQPNDDARDNHADDLPMQQLPLSHPPILPSIPRAMLQVRCRKVDECETLGVSLVQLVANDVPE